MIETQINFVSQLHGTGMAFKLHQGGVDEVRKSSNLVILGVLGGTKNGTWGARIKILGPLFNTLPPLKPPLETILETGKVIFGHFLGFGHFPIEAEKFYGKWKEGSYIKNKNSFETSEPSGKTWEYAK